MAGLKGLKAALSDGVTGLLLLREARRIRAALEQISTALHATNQISLRSTGTPHAEDFLAAYQRGLSAEETEVMVREQQELNQTDDGDYALMEAQEEMERLYGRTLGDDELSELRGLVDQGLSVEEIRKARRAGRNYR